MRQIEPPAGLRDLGHKRHLLTQRLKTRKQFDPEGFAELAALCFQMQDLFHAGRLYLFSGAEGEPIEKVIDYFAERCHRKPHSMLAQIPRYCLFEDTSLYPVMIRERLARLGISAEDIRASRVTKNDAGSQGRGWVWTAIHFYIVGCLILGVGASLWLLFLLAVWLVG